MQKKQKPYEHTLNVLHLSCALYVPTTIIINLLCHFFLYGKLLQAWANLIIFAIICITSTCIYFAKHLHIKSFIFKCFSSVYTVLSFMINALVS